MNQEIYGYTLYPPRRHSEPGGPVLEVFIREAPSEHHFDPETVLLTVTDDIANVLQLSIEHPWSGALDLRVCAGPIDLIDRKDKHLECLSYGGELHCEVSPAFTRLILHSTAPILIRPGHSIANLLAEETEILLAERRAAKPNSETFEKHLASADPLALYRACLEVLQARLRKLPPDGDELMFKFKHMLQNEREAVEQILPGLFNLSLELIL